MISGDYPEESVSASSQPLRMAAIFLCMLAFILRQNHGVLGSLRECKTGRRVELRELEFLLFYFLLIIVEARKRFTTYGSFLG